MSMRYEEESSGSFMAVALGALAGLAVGVIVAQRFGGVAGIADRLTGSFGRTRALPYDNFGRGEMRDSAEMAVQATAADIDADDIGIGDEFEEDELDTIDDEELDATLEENVLEAFRNDPILSECAIDIGALGDGIIELAGMVDTDEQARHAVTIARGVPDVDTVVNRMVVSMDEIRLDDGAGQLDGDDDETPINPRWEGQQVGTGKRRQGRSDEPDRHQDPKPELEERWLSEGEAVANAAGDIGETGNRTGAKKLARGARRSGAPAAPPGVPKADHVDPEQNPDL